MTQRSRKAIFIGAGIAGPIAAILLKRAGFEAQLFARPPQRQQQARVQPHRRLDSRPDDEALDSDHRADDELDVQLQSRRAHAST